MRFEELRESVLASKKNIYLNTGWAGPSPREVLAEIISVLKQEAERKFGSTRWMELMQETADAARRAVASLLKTDACNVLLTHSTKEAINIIMHGFRWKPDDELLICDLEHTAITTPATCLKDRYGIRIVCPSIPANATKSEILQIVERAITSKTRLAALSHLQFSCGLLMPIKDIARILHQREVPFLVDGAQSAGHINVDVVALGCDFYTLSGQKWLLGPVGVGALYMSRQYHHMLEPLLTPHGGDLMWAENSYPLSRFSLASNNPALFAGLSAAVRLAMEIGIEQIEQRIITLSDILRKNLSSVPCSLLTPNSAKTTNGLITVRLNGWQNSELVEVLQKHFGITSRAVDYPSGVRFSVSHFNNESEMLAAALALKRLAEQRNTLA